MIIAIDARLWGLEHTGLGRYVMKLVEELLQLDTEYLFVLLVRKKYFEEVSHLAKKSQIQVKVVIVDADHYSWTEQFLVPYILYKEKVDLLHVPHFNFPILWFGPLIVTIHDLIKLSFKGVDSTTKSQLIYWPRWIVSWILTWMATIRANKIITPSLFTGDDIRRRWHTDIRKFKVTYEAPDPLFFKSLVNVKIENSLIYTGNVYPHKNVLFLLKAIKKYNELHPDFHIVLKVVCGRSVFTQRLEKMIAALDMGNQVVFLGQITDEQLRTEYRKSIAFISASLMEGFGLPGLEAMAAGTLVVVSRVSSMPEIYGEHAIYFDPYTITSCIGAIEKVINVSDRHTRIMNGIEYARTFSWTQMAQQTLATYDECAYNISHDTGS